MKKIKLERLDLRNFKGFSFSLYADGADVSVWGANATGKTTLADAFSWLLFDKDSLGRSDFEIKNINVEGEAEHGLEHSVKGIIRVDGKTIILKKAYREIWTKKRGSATATFTGHTTDFYVDGVPVQKKDYQAQVAEIAGDESIFRLLTSPSAFPALHWHKQRALLLEMCGDISDADVIASDRTLSGEKLADVIGKRTIDDYRKIITARRTEINKELEKVPVRIDEVRRGLPDITGMDRVKAEGEVNRLEAALSDAKLRLQGISTGGRMAELTKQHVEAAGKLSRLEQSHYAETMRLSANVGQEITELEAKLRADRNQATMLESVMSRNTRQIESIERELEGLREKWAEAEAQVFQDSTSTVDTCAACGQSLPSERVQAAREKARAAFNRNKAEKLTDIENRGRRLKEEQDTAIAGRIRAQEEIISIQSGTAAAHLKDLLAQRDALRASASDYSQVEGHAELIVQVAEVAIAIRQEQSGHSEDRDKIQRDIDALTLSLKKEKEIADRFRRREAGEKRIGELKAEEKKLATEYELQEREVYLIELFIRTKVSLLTERINSRFKSVRFKLFNVLVNQGVEECCEITVGGIPYNGGLNNAARINAGCDVISALSLFYGLQAPIFIDNAESVCQLLDMDTQVIRLVVSDHDSILRIETPRSTREAVAA